jgi:transcriptional regulator with XRE-family HTH domain
LDILTILKNMVTPIMRLVAQRVRRLRERAGWSQVDLARRAGVSQKTISNIENEGGVGRTTVRLESLEQVAHAFRLEVWQLLLPDKEVPDDVISSPSISRLVQVYTSTDAAGRQDIERISEIVGKYYKTEETKFS